MIRDMLIAMVNGTIFTTIKTEEDDDTNTKDKTEVTKLR